jgi:hypothetical protein
LKKLTILVAALAMLMVASVPALAQYLTVDCSDLYPGIMPTDCVVDEDGLITLPDGTKAPYTVTGNSVTVQEGDLDPVPGVDRDSARFVQYDNAVNGNPEIAECYEPRPDGTCSAWLDTDGNLSQA